MFASTSEIFRSFSFYWVWLNLNCNFEFGSFNPLHDNRTRKRERAGGEKANAISKIVRMGWLVRRLVDLSISMRWSELNFDDVYTEFVFNINANIRRKRGNGKKNEKNGKRQNVWIHLYTHTPNPSSFLFNFEIQNTFFNFDVNENENENELYSLTTSLCFSLVLV